MYNETILFIKEKEEGKKGKEWAGVKERSDKLLIF